MKAQNFLEDHCPHCGREINDATFLGKEETPPEPGAFSICLGCACISVFKDDLRLRLPTLPELLQALSMREIQVAIEIIRRTNENN